MSESVVFDRAVEFYDATRGFPPGVEEEMAAAIARHAGLTEESRVLEIGVGTGRIALPLSRHVGRLTGVDLSRPMMQVLRRKQAAEPVELVEGDATRLPFAAATFDLALAIHVLHLVPRWQEAAAEMARVVRPGGAILINRSMSPDTRDEMMHQWHHFLEAHGAGTQAARDVGTRDIHAIAALFAMHGFDAVEEGVAAEWPNPRRPADTLDALARRVWSSTWDLPEPAFSRALADLRRWSEARYADQHEVTNETQSFAYSLFRKRATDG